jgi:molybdopterin converting factor small subunit
MMNITLMAYGEPRDIIGEREMAVSLGQNASLGDLMQYLAREFGPSILGELKKIRGLRILIDGRECQPDHSETTLKEGDTVVFMSPIFGG